MLLVATVQFFLFVTYFFFRWEKLIKWETYFFKQVTGVIIVCCIALFLWNTEIKDILGEEKVSGLLLHDLAADRTYELPVDALFVALGHIPAPGLFVPPLADTDGFIAVDTPSTATNFAGVFAAGDCSDAHYRQAVTAAASGCRAALDAENYLAAKNGNK